MLESLLARVQDDPAVLAVILFGSHARGEAAEGSDVDVCLVLMPGGEGPTDQSAARLAYLAEGPDTVDVRVFQQLPLYVRERVLREGRVLYCRDVDALYDRAYRTVKEMERFRPFYRGYLEQVAHGRP